MIENLFFANEINLAFNLTNAALLAVGLFFLARAFISLRRNSVEVKALSKLFDRNEAPVNKDKINEWFHDQKRSSKGILHRSVGTLMELSETTMEDRDKILYLEEIRNEIQTAIPKVVPGLAVLIGFLGTVLGLYLAILAMPRIFEGPNFEASDESFNILIESMVFSLNGMSIAFGTTLVGLSVSLILTIGNLVYGIFWGKLDHKLHYLLNIKLFPIYNKPDDENTTMRLLDAIDESKETMKLIRISNENLIKGISGLSNSMSRYNEKTERLVMQVFRAVDQFINSQKENQGVFTAIQKIAEEASKSYFKVENLLNTAKQDRGAFMAYLQDSRDEIKEISTLQHQAYERTSQDYLDKQKKANEEFLKRQAQKEEQFLKSQNTLYQNQLGYFKEENKKYQDTFEKMRQDLITNVQKENKDRLKEIETQSKNLQQKIEDIANKTSQGISSQVTETNKSVQENVRQLRKTVEELTKNLSENSRQYEDETKKLIQKLSALVMKSIETNNHFIG